VVRIPFNPMLSYPTVKQILEETNFQLLCGKDHLESYISRVVVGAMRPANAVRFIVNDSLLIMAGDSDEMLKAALSLYREEDKARRKLSGIILSGGFAPDKELIDLLAEAQIPVLVAPIDTYSVVSIIHDLTVKIRPENKTKIDTAVKLIKDYVDLDQIVKGI